jgi:hypothetical protein
MMYIFNTCKGFIRTIPLLQYDEHKVEDLDTDGEDHIADEVRYFCMARPIKPRAAVKRDPYLDNPAYAVLGIEKLPKATVRQRMQIIGGEDDE